MLLLGFTVLLRLGSRGKPRLMLNLFRKRWDFDSRRYPLACWRVPFITGSDGSSSLRLFFPLPYLPPSSRGLCVCRCTPQQHWSTCATRHSYRYTLRASLSGTFLHTCQNWLRHCRGTLSLSPRGCPPTLSAPSERFGYHYGKTLEET